MMKPAACALFACLSLGPPAAAQDGASAPPSGDAAPGPVAGIADIPLPPDELVLPADHIIRVTVDGLPLRLLVTAEASGPAAVNPQIAAQLGWISTFEIQWDYGGGDRLRSVGLWRMVDFGGFAKETPLMWSVNPASSEADGVIGIHHLPYKRVVFPLAAATGEQTVQRFPISQIGSDRAMTIGTEVDTGDRKLKVFFVLERPQNLVTAPTANYLATRFDGGFVPGSEGSVTVGFGVQRRTREMRLARPLELGELMIDRFAVRYDDHGKAKNVGEIGPDDPRFNPKEIIVSSRKKKGRADYLTRIGRDQIAHCSSLTYDLAAGEILLSCGPAPE